MEKGRLINKVTMSSGGDGFRSLPFNYNFDPPILVQKDSIINKLNFYEMRSVYETKNLSEIIKQMDNIFLIKEKDLFDGYYVARKVKF